MVAHLCSRERRRPSAVLVLDDEKRDPTHTHALHLVIFAQHFSLIRVCERYDSEWSAHRPVLNQQSNQSPVSRAADRAAASSPAPPHTSSSTARSHRFFASTKYAWNRASNSASARSDVYRYTSTVCVAIKSIRFSVAMCEETKIRHL